MRDSSERRQRHRSTNATGSRAPATESPSWQRPGGGRCGAMGRVGQRIGQRPSGSRDIHIKRLDTCAHAGWISHATCAPGHISPSYISLYAIATCPPRRSISTTGTKGSCPAPRRAPRPASKMYVLTMLDCASRSISRSPRRRSPPAHYYPGAGFTSTLGSLPDFTSTQSHRCRAHRPAAPSQARRGCHQDV